MSRPKYAYYGEVKKRIRGYTRNRPIKTIMQGIYDTAIARALDETERLPDGKDRLNVIWYVLMNGGSIDGATYRCNCSYSTACRWISQFVNTVALYSGNLEPQK